MRSGPADLARRLFRKAGNDLLAAEIGLAHGAPLDTVCFHVQQAAEKLLKACLAAKDAEYPFTHELRQLLELAIPDSPFLQEFQSTLPEYTEFAVRFRYDELPWITGEGARAAFAVVARLRDEVGAALGFLE
ncbi:MAG: HEPN domain-containing protein [Bryobacterales bacterium]|nr:HEPN domain-containing protein [Bryobacterales bacterium]